MPAINTDFGQHGEVDPFVAGYERLKRDAKGNLIDYVSATTRSDDLQITREQIAGIAHMYFLSPYDISLGDPRGKSLKNGMLLGLYAGGLSLARFRRKRFYTFIRGQLIFDSPVFCGYHWDTDSIEQATNPVYSELGSVIDLPDQKEVQLNEALEAGVGWMATQVAEYRRRNAGEHALRVILTRDKDEVAINASIKALKRHGEVTTADFL